MAELGPGRWDKGGAAVVAAVGIGAEQLLLRWSTPMANSPAAVAVAAGIAGGALVPLGHWEGSQGVVRQRSDPRVNHKQTFLILVGGRM